MVCRNRGGSKVKKPAHLQRHLAARHMQQVDGRWLWLVRLQDELQLALRYGTSSLVVQQARHPHRQAGRLGCGLGGGDNQTRLDLHLDGCR